MVGAAGAAQAPVLLDLPRFAAIDQSIDPPHREALGKAARVVSAWHIRHAMEQQPKSAFL